jgi:hypothetical protein
MRRLENYVRKYGPEFGPIYFHTLQSQAAHAQVASRLRRKLDILAGKIPAPARSEKPLPLFEAVEAELAPGLVAN